MSYSNTGGEASGVQLTVRVNPRARVVTDTVSSGWVCNVNGASTCTIDVGTLKKGASGSQVLVARAVSSSRLSSTIVATARITDDGTHLRDTNLSNNQDLTIVIGSLPGALMRSSAMASVEATTLQQLTIAIFWSASADQSAPELLKTAQITTGQPEADIARALAVDQARVAGLSNGVVWAELTDTTTGAIIDPGAPLALIRARSTVAIFLALVAGS